MKTKAKKQETSSDEELREQEEAARNKRGEALALAVQKGGAIAQAYTDSVKAGIQKVVGKKFVSDETGLRVEEGVKLTEADLAAAISGLSNSSSMLNTASASVGWNLGDLVILTREFPDGDSLVEQAVALTGKDKHTVRETERLCEFFPHDRRHGDLTMTHHMEVFNYSKVKDADGKRVLTDAKLFGVLDKAAKGEKITDIDTASGEEIVIYKPWSCAQLRKHLQELTGKKKPQKEESEDGGGDESCDEPKEKKGFLYIDGEFNIFHHGTMPDEAVDPQVFLVIDLDTGECFAAGERTPTEVQELPAEYLPADEQPAPKAKKTKKVKKEEAPEPEDGGDENPPE
jgi:hypothetical protein